jgi:hypothetical protein
VGDEADAAGVAFGRGRAGVESRPISHDVKAGQR